MSPQGPHNVPRRYRPAVVTVDAGSTGSLSPRFLTLVVHAYREWEPPAAADPVWYPVADLPAAS